MNQKLSDWASLAEIIASVSVVVTLIVLIVGVRENTEVVRASAYSETLNSINDLQIATLQTPEAVDIWDKYISGADVEFDQLNNQRLHLILLTLFRAYESAYYSQDYGLIGNQEWLRLSRSICQHYDRVVRLDKLFVLESSMTEQFIEHMVEAC